MTDPTPTMPKWKPGDRVDFVSLGKQGQAQAKGSFDLDKGRPEGEGGTRQAAVVDQVIDESTIRLLLMKSMEYVWAQPSEVHEPEVIDRLADLAGPEGRSLQDGLEEMEDEEAGKLKDD